MNHNYYYILLGKKAGGTAAQLGCTSTGKYLRFAQGPPNTAMYEGYVGDVANATSSLAFGSSIEVWTSPNLGWPLIDGSSPLYLDENLTQELPTSGDGWFQIEDQLFKYSTGTRAVQITPTGLPQTQDTISIGDPTVCQTLAGPFTTPIWANSDNWQTTTKVTLDQAGTQPFPGQDLWYAVEGNGINGMGTTIQINNCGQVTGLYAC